MQLFDAVLKNNFLEGKENNRKKGMFFSVLLHAVLFLLFILPWFSYQYPPPEQEGVLVSFGWQEQGGRDEMPDTQNEELVEPTQEEKVSEATESIIEESEAESSKGVDEELLLQENSDVLALKAEEEAKKRAQEEKLREEKRKEEERKAEELRKQREKEEFEEAKKQFGAVFGSGNGKEKESGNTGTQEGEPNADNLSGISSGSGQVGGGLGDRGLRASPTIRDKSQKSGTVVVDVCVNSSGDVISANYTQRGSTTTDKELRTIAEKSARQFKFTESDKEKQCGTITIDFKLR